MRNRDETLNVNYQAARKAITKLSPLELQDALTEIFEAMDGEHWGGDTCAAVSGVFIGLGVNLLSPDELEDD